MSESARLQQDEQTPHDGMSAREVHLVRLIMGVVGCTEDEHDAFEALERLVHALVELLPAAESGLLLVDDDGQPGLVACTDESSKHLELYQQQRKQGPCLDAVRTGRRVVVPDLTKPGPWPDFARPALARGFRSVLAVPMRHGEGVIGGVNVFFRSAGISESATRTAQVLVDAGAMAIATRRRLEHAATLADQLNQALRSRVAIEQAKGVLAEHTGISVEAAFGLLRGYARERRIKLLAAAEAIAAREIDPADVVAAAVRHGR